MKLADASKLKLKFFVFCLRITNIKALHWEFQCNYANFENILKILLTLIKQTCSTRSIWKAQVRTIVRSMFQVGRKAAELEQQKLQTEMHKEKSELRRKKLEKCVQMASSRDTKGAV